jgi:hypothetical protein
MSGGSRRSEGSLVVIAGAPFAVRSKSGAGQHQPFAALIYLSLAISSLI